MSTALQLPPTPDVAYFSRGILGEGVVVEDRPDGTGTLRNLAIFRTGELTDSKGNKFTWESHHLEAAVENFNALRDELPDVPVRAGHNRSVNAVVGYYESVRTDGKRLYADVEITEPEAWGKVKRRTYRGRSLEIGVFNSGKHGLTWPTVLGLAFVDIPAVSHLYESPVGDKQYTVITESESMGNTANQNATVDTQNLEWALAAHYAQGLADAPKPQEPPKFQCYGAEVTDYAKVQEHIAALEKFQRETGEATRKSFVSGLVDSKRILATQKESFEKLVLGMDSEQFALFTQGFADAPAHSLLGEHGNGSGGSGGSNPPAGETPAAQHIKDLEAIVSMHQRQGLTREQLEKTPSYIELQQLKK